MRIRLNAPTQWTIGFIHSSDAFEVIVRKVQKQTKTVELRYCRHPSTQTSCETDILSGSLCGDSDRASTGVWQAKEV